MVGSIVKIIEKEVKFMTFEIVFVFLTNKSTQEVYSNGQKLIKTA